MPHVQIEGRCDIRRFWTTFQPKTLRAENRIVKTIDAYLETEERGILIECLVVEDYLRQSFLAHLVSREDGLLVKIFHASNPERTVGVRTALAWLATQLLEQSPEARWSADNLGLSTPPADAG